VVTAVIVVVDEIADMGFEIAWQLVVFFSRMRFFKV